MDIKKIACVGAGVIGTGWATNFIMKGYPVKVYDITEELLTKAKERVTNNLNFLMEKGVLNREAYRQALNLAEYTNLIFHLGGGAAGIKGMVRELLGPSLALWLKDVAKWEEIPQGWGEIAQAGVEEEMAKRLPGTGRTTAELLQYRDDMLLGLLKLHQKL